MISPNTNGSVAGPLYDVVLNHSLVSTLQTYPSCQAVVEVAPHECQLFDPRLRAIPRVRNSQQLIV